MSQAACCTCASLLAAVPRVSSSSEKPLPDDRQLGCCGRTICGACIHRNRRFLHYCPYCQTSNQPMPSSRPRARLRQGVTEEDESETETETESEPPPYSAIAQTINPKAERTKPSSPPPPPYTSPFHPPPSPNPEQPPKEKEEQEEQGEQDPQPPYTIHHLRHPPHPSPDSLTSLSLRYGIPAHILRQHNSLPNDADYLLAARHTLLIPTAYITTKPNTTTNPSLSPHPPGDAASRERKVQIRRFMVACKEADYDAAVVYLEASGHDFDEAVARHRADAAWERANPNPSPSRNSLGGSGGGSRGKGVCRGEEGRGAWGMGMGMVGETGKGKAVVKAGGGGEGRLFAWLKG